MFRKFAVEKLPILRVGITDKFIIYKYSIAMKRLILLAMVLCGLALSSCEKEPKHRSYYVLYFSAHVVDEAGNPIQGIYSYPEPNAFYGRTGYSDYQGEISGFVHLHPSELHNIVFEDVDGEANGGEFITTTLLINDREEDLGIVTLYREGEEKDN